MLGKLEECLSVEVAEILQLEIIPLSTYNVAKQQSAINMETSNLQVEMVQISDTRIITLFAYTYHWQPKS